MKSEKGKNTWRYISTEIDDWTAFKDNDLREQDFGFRLSTLGESSLAPQHPLSEFQALMEAAPGDEPDETAGELQELREVVATAIDRLSEEHRFIIDAINSERISLAALGERLGVGKTQAWRLHRAAVAALRTELSSIPLIRERLGMDPIDNVIPLRRPTWNSAARSAVEGLRPEEAYLEDHIAFGVIQRKIDSIRVMVKDRIGSDKQLGRLVISVGVCAANMLATRGLWDEDEIVALLCRKQHDYGHANILSFGMIGVAIRDSDKVARWANLSANGAEGTTEPAIDALLDMVGYAVIAQMLLDDTFLLELAA